LLSWLALTSTKCPAPLKADPTLSNVKPVTCPPDVARAAACLLPLRRDLVAYGDRPADDRRQRRIVEPTRQAHLEGASGPEGTIGGNASPRAPMRVYAKHGYAKEFEASGRYIGHFVGTAVHDVIDIVGGAARKPFVAGTIFNVEPILEIPDRKIHIRLEDTIVVTDTGADNLTAAVPAEVEPLYALIRQKGVNSAPLADRPSR
jgi:hypothetical protein